MATNNESAIAFLIPRCFRRKKTPPTSEMVGNIFEQRMKQRLKKEAKRSYRVKYTRSRPVDDEFTTFDLLASRERAIATKYANRLRKEQWPQVLSWDSNADTYVSPPSSVGAEAGGIVGTTHTKNPRDDDPETSSRYTAELTRLEVSQEAAFCLQELAHLDLSSSTPSFVYQVPQQSARKWSTATTEGSVELHSTT